MNATRFPILGALAASLLLMPACDDKKPEGKSETKAEALPNEKPSEKPAENADTKAEAKADTKAPAEDAPKPEGDEGAESAEGGDDLSVGVAICDEYIAKYSKCIEEKAPEENREGMRNMLTKTAERFRKQSEGPEKDSLEQGCKASLEAAKKTTKAWGCTYD